MTTTNETMPPEQEFVTDKTGDLNEAPERTEHGTQVIPEGAAVGEPDYDTAAKEMAAKGFLKVLMEVFTPQPKPGVANPNGTPENEFKDGDSLTLVRDTLRYIGSTSVKVTDVPARWAKFVRQAVGEAPTRIAGYQPNRKAITIKAIGDEVYLGEGAEITDETGFILAEADGPITIHTTDEIWAVCANGESSTLHIIGEHYE